MSESGEAHVVHAFLERFVGDRDAGEPRDLAHYLALWPGHEAVIEREYRAVTEPDAGRALLGPYRLLEEIGRGAQGVVYRARDEALDRTVALKVLRRRIGDDPRVLLRFQREARAASRLDHPGICTVYGSGVEGGTTYIAMRLVQGEPLSERVAARGAGDVAATVALFEQAARALHAAHEAGVIHRDLKPGNIMVEPDGRPVLLDFGLAGGPEAGPTLTATGDVFGTPAYMPPEQLRGHEVDRRGDVYALGVCLFEAVTGQRPHEAATLETLYRKILEGDVRDPRSVNAAVPVDLATIIATAMDPDPARRYATAALVADDLRRLRERQPITARPASPWLRLGRWTQRNPALAGLLIVITTALFVTGWLLRESERKGRELSRAQFLARLGEMRQREERIDDLLRRGYQTGFGALPDGATAHFGEVLRLDPGNAEARAGLFLLALPDRDAAAAVLRAHPPGDPDIAWLQARLAGADAPGPGSDLQAFLEGHLAVGFFRPPVDPASAERALAHFRTAIMRAPRPRFHHYHSLLMAAQRADDVGTMREAETALVHHWPDAQATWEAIAQFFFPVDRDKAVAAMQRILALGPSAAAHLGLATVSQTDGKPDEALRHFDEALAVEPTMGAAHWMRAQLLWSLDRKPEAKRAYAEAVVHARPHFLDFALKSVRERVDDPDLLAEIAKRRPDVANLLPR